MRVEQFQETLITLRILAKFLGFLESHAYHSEELGSDLVTGFVTVRDNVRPALDLAAMVTSATDQVKLLIGQYCHLTCNTCF